MQCVYLLRLSGRCFGELSVQDPSNTRRAVPAVPGHPNCSGFPRVAFGMVSGRILRMVTGIVCLCTLVMLGDIPHRTEHLVVIYVSTFIEIRYCFNSEGRIGINSSASTKHVGIYIFVSVSLCRLLEVCYVFVLFIHCIS